MDLGSTPPMTARASPKSTWAWPGGCVSGTNISPALSDTADVVLHNGDLARKAVLITSRSNIRNLTLLLRTILILFQDTVDNTDELPSFGRSRRPRPDITRWHRIAQHLDRARVDPKTKPLRVGSDPQSLRVATIQFHSLHPPPLQNGKGIADGILLRRNQNLRPLQWIIAAERSDKACLSIIRGRAFPPVHPQAA